MVKVVYKKFLSVCAKIGQMHTIMVVSMIDRTASRTAEWVYGIFSHRSWM